jgi:glucose/mannose-6-phosphate isomerase
MSDRATVGSLGRGDVERLDPGGMLADVLAQPHQLGDALWRVESASVPERDLRGGLVVCGMGGSAIGGDLAAAVIGNRARRPIRTLRDHLLEPWAGDDALYLCASYSGDTEETLDLFRAAGRAGAPRVVLTTGGALAEAARAEDVPVVGAPAGLQPRAAVVYMVVAALECAALCGAAPSLREEIAQAAQLLERLATEWGPDAPDDALPKVLARALRGTVPVIYGAGPTAPVALRWKAQLNENAKTPAFHGALPEATHNEIVAWEGSGDLAPFSAVFLDDPGLTPRARRRMELTARAVGLGAAGVETVLSRGETAFERVASLVMLGDLVSVYLAVLNGVDPTPVEPIERFKRALEEDASVERR